MLKVQTIPIFNDNYVYVLYDDKQKRAAVIDPGEAEPVIKWLQDTGLKLDYILNTHHHSDHIGGNAALKKRYGCQIIAPKSEHHRIENIDIPVSEGDICDLFGYSVEIMETAGHTLGHVIYYLPNEKKVFVGDTLFSMGCGRLFEGSAEQMWISLLKIKSLPDDIVMYCTHEYTADNIQFCLDIEPDNQDILSYRDIVSGKRSRGEATAVVLLADEKKRNPFLRADELNLKIALGHENESDIESFARLRKRKDIF